MKKSVYLFNGTSFTYGITLVLIVGFLFILPAVLGVGLLLVFFNIFRLKPSRGTRLFLITLTILFSYLIVYVFLFGPLKGLF